MVITPVGGVATDAEKVGRHAAGAPGFNLSHMESQTSLLPREHGAYAQLAFPLVTGLGLATPSLPAVALALAAVAFFLANEPVAILLGTRGQRLEEKLGKQARSRGAILAGLGTGLGLLGVCTGGAILWPALAYPMAAAALLIPVVLLGKQKTLFGEFLVITTFATLLLPLAAASGAHPIRAGLAAAVWWISFGLGTLEVHAIKASLRDSAKRQWTRLGSPLAAGATVLAALWLALGQASPWLKALAPGSPPEGGARDLLPWADAAMRLLPPSAAALLPPALAILVLSMLRVHPRHLKRVGWTLVGANALALILLLQG